MKILLIDADSTIPNIALMRLSSYLKNSNHDIVFNRLGLSYYPSKNKKTHTISSHNFDVSLCSIIFNTNKNHVRGDNCVFGGSGIDLYKKLPKTIEDIKDLDYSLYPDNDTSYGFISRGCIRKCAFCIVPEKEGWIRQVSKVSDVIKHKKVKFLDDNILALDNHEDILRELITSFNTVKCSFNQGLDIRLLNDRNSRLLSMLNYDGNYTFAFDSYKYLDLIKNKLKLLKWRKDWEIRMFVYVHPKNTLTGVVKRILFLREMKILPYIMRDLTCFYSRNKDFYSDLAAYCNQPNIFKKCDFELFLNKRHKKIKRVEHSLNLWVMNQ